ncbi:MAG: hypothetical protein KF857_01850 [Fimbriimonadaceae bacterium]|nr:hypothetical protein [Fimbriimonadaceae bacterium]
MVRIVGVQRSQDVAQEFVLLQNQGAMRVCLRGHAVVAESAHGAACPSAAFVLPDCVDLMPGQYALLRSGRGTPRWCHTEDGLHIFYTYLGRETPVWADQTGPFHLLAPQHSYIECQREVVAV